MDALPKDIIVYISQYLDTVMIKILTYTSKYFEEISEDIAPLNYKLSTSSIAKCNYIGILRWVRQDGCPWDNWTCELTARNGNLKLLKWLRKGGCPWGNWTLTYTTSWDRWRVLQWAINDGYPRYTRGIVGNIRNEELMKWKNKSILSEETKKICAHYFIIFLKFLPYIRHVMLYTRKYTRRTHSQMYQCES